LAKKTFFLCIEVELVPVQPDGKEYLRILDYFINYSLPFPDAFLNVR
jgi:hypothetical protein